MNRSTIPSLTPPTTRRPWALRLAIFLVLLGALSNLFYLYHNCPIDFSEDESHYWLWSQHLDYGYYSKPPGIAWVLAAAQKIGEFLHLTGDGSGTALMPVLRTPAIVFGFCSGLLSLFLARRMFRDDRTALTVIVLSAAVPMFSVGSLLITIDSPMYLCWTLTVFALWRHIEKNASGFRELPTTKLSPAWLYLAGLFAALGMLFKPVLLVLPVCMILAAILDPFAKRAFKTWHSLGALIVMLLSQVPVLVWNANHDWVTFKHIGTQGGFVGAGQKTSLLAPLSRIGEFVGGQAGAMGVLPFLLLVAAVIVAIRTLRKPPLEATSPTEAETAPLQRRSALQFLLAFTLPLWAFYFLMNLWKGTEVNWPAASYFTGMILTAGIVSSRWNLPPSHLRRNWRFWVILTVSVGFCLTMIAMNFQRLYPLAAKQLVSRVGTPKYFTSPWHPTRWDQPTVRLRGLANRAAELDQRVDELRAKTGKEPLLISNRYDVASSLTFYMKNHPFVFCIGSSVGERHSQFDLWPGINQKNADGSLTFAGRPALIVGWFNKDDVPSVLTPAFDHLETSPRVPVIFNGIQLKDVNVMTGYDFKGLPLSSNNKY